MTHLMINLNRLSSTQSFWTKILMVESRKEYTILENKDFRHHIAKTPQQNYYQEIVRFLSEKSQN